MFNENSFDIMYRHAAEYSSNMTLRPVLSSFITVVVTVTGITEMPVQQLRML
jgi:hypothetical protein